MSTPAPKPPTAANRLGLDYRAEAARLGPPPAPIIDAHAHIGGESACRVYDEVRRLFGVERTYTMTQIAGAGAVRDALGGSVRFIAFPSFMDPDRLRAHREGYPAVLERFHAEFGSRMMKVWASPRLRDVLGVEATDLYEVDSPWRRRACEAGARLGMMYMIHVADPDTWFATKYKNAARYGTKREQYAALERMLDDFPSPWIAAHMGGWPEDLAFLDGMLTRHPNLHLDTSATKWVVRELSLRPREEVRAFFTKWGGAGRVLFGSDIVTSDDQLKPQKSGASPMGDLADSPESAWELYASRYWALRAFFETAYDGESPIADPDLAMVDPVAYTPMSAPRLRGAALPASVLRTIYSGAAAGVIEKWEREHP